MTEVPERPGSTDTNGSPSEWAAKPEAPRGLRALAQQFTHRDHTQGRLLISILVLALPAVLSSIGSHVQAAYTIGLRIEMIAVMIAFPIANACATLVGQNLGAGNVDRAWRSVYVSAAVEICILGAGAVALYFFRDVAVAAFANDPAVAAHASEYLRYVSFILGFWGIYFVAFRTLQAAGDMITPMLISLALALGLGTPLAIYLSSQPEYGASGMWIANIVYSTANTLAMLV